MPTTVFKTFYDRNDLPIVCNFSGATRCIEWRVAITQLDYHHYLPVFFEGLREPTDPCKFLADRGCDDLIRKGGPKLLPVLPQLILPLKSALQTKRKDVVVKTLKKMQLLVQTSPEVAQAMVPYYR